MDNTFEITFDFPISHSSFTIPLKATVQPHHSEPSYVVDSFFFENRNRSESALSLPGIDIKYLKAGNMGSWVHKSSERESLLSQAIGKAIEKSGHFNGRL